MSSACPWDWFNGLKVTSLSSTVWGNWIVSAGFLGHWKASGLQTHSRFPTTWLVIQQQENNNNNNSQLSSSQITEPKMLIFVCSKKGLKFCTVSVADVTASGTVFGLINMFHLLHMSIARLDFKWYASQQAKTQLPLCFLKADYQYHKI